MGSWEKWQYKKSKYHNIGEEKNKIKMADNVLWYGLGLGIRTKTVEYEDFFFGQGTKLDCHSITAHRQTDQNGVWHFIFTKCVERFF